MVVGVCHFEWSSDVRDVWAHTVMLTKRGYHEPPDSDVVSQMFVCT